MIAAIALLRPFHGSRRQSTSANRYFSYRQRCNDGQRPGTPYAASRGWDYGGITSADVTSAGGDVQHFAYWSNTYSLEGVYECGFAQGFRLASWSFPQGVSVSLTYGNKDDPQKPGSGHGFEQLVSVTNSVGREIDFVNGGRSGFNNALGGTDARSVSLTAGPRPQAWLPSQVTDPKGVATTFAFLPPQTRSDTQRPVPHGQLMQIYTPDKPDKPNLQYNYDAIGRVKEADFAHSARGLMP